ncbi:MAG TPA: class I SAM-dependent methyltransferase, partial [Arenimonas sp.]|nr:class I SAM-dependent methyltransferase [Arenimonas sp.]
MTASAHDLRRAAWSSYWTQGPMHSCIGSFDAGYTGAIGDFWDAQAAAMAPGARVLDLATGNGALPLRFWERHGDSIAIDAVDLAALAPRWHRPGTHPRIRFHQGVAMEALPFPDASHDRVVSQFGFEYADGGPALDECLRVLAPGGTLAFVMHHAGSVLVSVGREELANVECLLEPGGVLEAAAAVAPWILRARSGDPGVARSAEANRAREHYNLAMAGLADKVAASPVPDSLVEARQWIHRVLADAGIRDAATLEATLAAHRDALRSAALRTSEMIEHALDASQ